MKWRSSASAGAQPTLQPLSSSPEPRLGARSVGLCSLFTLRYEAPYLLPWLAWHLMAGVSHVWLYQDDASPSYSPALAVTHARLLKLLGSASDRVTLRSMAGPRLGKNARPRRLGLRRHTPPADAPSLMPGNHMQENLTAQVRNPQAIVSRCQIIRARSMSSSIS